MKTSGDKVDNSVNTSVYGTTLVSFQSTSRMIFRITRVELCLCLPVAVDESKVDEKIPTQSIKLTSSFIRYSSKIVVPARNL